MLPFPSSITWKFGIIILSFVSVNVLCLNLPKQHKTLKHKTVTVKNKTEDKLHTTNKYLKLFLNYR